MIDEVPHNERSGECILPILGCLMNLPPDVRTNFDNIYVFGYWVGHGHPNLQVILEPIVHDFMEAFETGVRVQLNDVVFTSRAVVFACDSDMRMKELILHHTGPTSHNGCDKCTIKGVTVKYKFGGHATKFITVDVDPSNYTSEMRTHESWQKDVALVERMKMQKKNELLETISEADVLQNKEYQRIHSNGVKGPCVFSKLKYIDVTQLCLTQPMHCLFEKFVHQEID